MHHDKACGAGKANVCCKGLDNLWLYMCRKHSRFPSTWKHKHSGEQAWRQFVMFHYGPAWLAKFWLFYSLSAEELNRSRANGTWHVLNPAGTSLQTKPPNCGIWVLSLLVSNLFLKHYKKKHFCPPVSETCVKHSYSKPEGARQSSDSFVWMKKIWSGKKDKGFLLNFF